MNEIVKAPARRKWTLAELDRLSALGFFGDHEHVELIGAELYQMPAKGIRHENVRSAIVDFLVARVTGDLRLRVELGWRPNEATYLEPDILLCRPGGAPALVPPAHVLVLIEVARSSLAHDQGLKADTYAALGVAEYWVVDAATLATRIHTQPAPDGYRERRDLQASETLVPVLVPELAVSLSDLGIDEMGLDDEDGT